MKHCRIALSAVLAAWILTHARAEPLVFDTDHLRLELSSAGHLTRLTDRGSGVEYLAPNQPAPLLQLRQAGEFHLPDELAWDAGRRVLTLRFAKAGLTATIGVQVKPTHLRFELRAVEPPAQADVALWGPYPTTIGAIVGETVGVVRNRDFALGIQALNPKTLGGYPTTEDDIMPSYDFFAGADLKDIAPEHREKELFRGDAARPTDFGSVLQAYCRDRSRDRVIANWGHPRFLAPAFADNGLVGSRLALFGCPADRALERLGAIEVAEGLPHPLIDGVWGKIAPEATASYLIVDFGEETLDAALELTLQAGLRYLYHGGPFRTWGHFDLHANQFPDGWASLKRCVERAGQRGVRLGVHTLSNFITPNDAYVTPRPDQRLARVGTTTLTHAIDAAQTEIPVADPGWFNQMQNNTLKTAVVGQELIRYGAVSEAAPWRLLDCQRGSWGTTAAAHAEGAAIAKLLDHGYRVFLTDATLTQEVARRLADLFNQTGLLQISFDGLEGNWSTGMGQYGRTLFTLAWYHHLAPALQGRVINDASNPGHFNWHVYTRMNWGEPWYAGFRESQTQYRLKNQNYYHRNLMPRMLGWFQMGPETTREDAEWLLARAAGFDAGFGLVTSPDAARRNGDGAAILEAIRHWETARLAGAFPAELKPLLQDVGREFLLRPAGDRAWTLAPVHSVKLTHARREQPGMPTASTCDFANPHPAQPLQFILQATGNPQAEAVTLAINGVEVLALTEPLAKGQSLKYTGGPTAVRYDPHWNPLGTVPVNPARLEVRAGASQIHLGTRFGTGDNPALKGEFRTVGPVWNLRAPGTAGT
jgi:hypothetical protein